MLLKLGKMSNLSDSASASSKILTDTFSDSLRASELDRLVSLAQRAGML